MAGETQNARVELDDALSTWTHRLGRYQAKQTTLNSVFSALSDVINPAVRITLVNQQARELILLCRLFFFVN